MDRKLKELALNIFDSGLVMTDGPFLFKLHEKHPGAPRSPIKFNLRFPLDGSLTWDMVNRVGDLYYHFLQQNQVRYDCVVGVPRAGVPFAQVVAGLASAPQLFLEKKETETKRTILPILQGEYERGWRVLVIDDVIVRAGSKIEAIEVLMAHGLIPKAVVVLVDWEHGGCDFLKACGLNVITVFKVGQLLSLYLKEKKISKEKHDEVIAYIRDVNSYLKEIRELNR